MTKARDFLADHNLAKREARGKFSNEAKEFLQLAIADGQKFEDWNEHGRIVQTPVKSIPAAPKLIRKLATGIDVARYQPVRKENTMRIISEEGHTVNIDTCNSCIKSIRYCRCEKMSPPAYMNAREWSLVVR
ncbi:hypothetical protein SEA_NICEHOUSE_225 [Rhodococcus phage NiceHouse]|nr:hypothetical protein SEA_NICEHOUSE_225 [Rhodococcus phage NiceHouse]